MPLWKFKLKHKRNQFILQLANKFYIFYEEKKGAICFH